MIKLIVYLGVAACKFANALKSLSSNTLMDFITHAKSARPHPASFKGLRALRQVQPDFSTNCHDQANRKKTGVL